MKLINLNKKILLLLFTFPFFLISSISAANLSVYLNTAWTADQDDYAFGQGSIPAIYSAIMPEGSEAQMGNALNGDMVRLDLNGGCMSLNGKVDTRLSAGFQGAGSIYIDSTTTDINTRGAIHTAVDWGPAYSGYGNDTNITFTSPDGYPNHTPYIYLHGSTWDTAGTFTVGDATHQTSGLYIMNGTIEPRLDDAWWFLGHTDSSLTFSNIIFTADPGYGFIAGNDTTAAGTLIFDKQCIFMDGLSLPVNLTYQSINKFYGALDLRGRQLTLAEDLVLAAGGSITSNGTIIGDGKSMIFKSNQTYENTLSVITSNLTIEGNGYELDLNNNGAFVVTGVSLTLKNMILKNLKSDWKSGTGSVVLGQNVTIIP
jgi:hypothetical protein